MRRALFLTFACLVFLLPPARLLAATDPCSLVTDLEARQLAAGTLIRPHELSTVRGTSICNWKNAHGIPVLMVQVTPTDPAGLKAGLESQLGPMGYQVVSVPGLGGEAVVAIQKANPKLGLNEEVAMLSVRVGRQVIGLSPAGLAIPGHGPKFLC